LLGQKKSGTSAFFTKQKSHILISFNNRQSVSHIIYPYRNASKRPVSCAFPCLYLEWPDR